MIISRIALYVKWLCWLVYLVETSYNSLQLSEIGEVLKSSWVDRRNQVMIQMPVETTNDYDITVKWMY